MNTVAKLILVCGILSTSISSSFGDTPSQGDYSGSRESFSAFTEKYARNDWPLPEMIGYYDPEGKSAETIRYAHWVPASANKTGVVVHFNGRTEFIERNIHTYKDLLQRGFEVWAMDWRGQGFSQRQITDKQKHSIDSFDTYLHDAEYFIKNVAHVKESSGKKILLAHSMGGQIALRYLIDDGDNRTFDYAVLSSPLLRIPGDSWYLQYGNKFKKAIGFGNSCVLGKEDLWRSNFDKGKACLIVEGEESIPAINASESRNYSNDFRRLAEGDCLIESSQDANGKEKPDLRLACPTSDWLHAAFQSTELVMKNANKIKTSILIVRAKPDVAVDNDGQNEFGKLANVKLKDITLVNGTQTGHELLIETQFIRERFFSLFDEFVGLKH